MIHPKLFLRLVIFSLTFSQSTLQAQQKDSLVLYRSTAISGAQPFGLQPGGRLYLAPGVHLMVEQDLRWEGSPARPIRIMSLDPEHPGAGIVVKARDPEAVVHLQHLVFEGLSQAIRFEAFWQRKEVRLQNLSLQSSWTGAPLVQVSTPLVDHRRAAKSRFTMHDILFQNNAAGIWLEGGALRHLDYDLQALRFQDNLVASGQALVHADLSEGSSSADSLGAFSFVRNRFTGTERYFSLSSRNRQALYIERVETDQEHLPLLDQARDPRLGKIVLAPLEKPAQRPAFEILSHRPGHLVFRATDAQAASAVVALLDRNRQVLDAEFSPSGDTLRFRYALGEAYFLALKDQGYWLLPPPDSSKAAEERTERGPGGQDSAVARVDSFAWQDHADWLRSLARIEQRLNRDAQKLGHWEVGLWGGGAVYGAGDLKPEFSFIENLVYVPSTIDWSLGLYAQYNINTRFSAKLSFYHSTISYHDISSVGVFSGSPPLMGLDENLQSVELKRWSYDARFLTHMAILDLELLWHMRPYRYSGRFAFWENLVPSLGASVGALHYTPYRTVYTGYEPDESYWSMIRRHRDQRVKLRELGMEGQHFIPGAEAYSSMALQAGLSFSVSWLFKGFSLKGEVRGAYTSTDYLDDYGPGIWWGGDRQAVLDNHQVKHDNADYLVPRTVGNINFPREANFRSTDGLNDWYFQGHFGLSVNLD